MFIDKLTGELAEQFAGSNLPISEKHIVEVKCSCGATTRLSTRALSRKWGAKGYYLCKSCSVKSYIDNPERLEKWHKSFNETAATPEHKARCSQGGRVVWADPITRKKITEAVRADNISNPKKAISREIALKALKEKSWFKDHMAKIRILAHQSIKLSLINDFDKWRDLSKNFHFERPEVKEKHRQSCKCRHHRKRIIIDNYDDLNNKIKCSDDYKKKIISILNNEKRKEELSHIQITPKQKRAKHNSVEHKIKLAAAIKSQWKNKEYRDKIKSVHDSEQYKTKMAAYRSTQSGRSSSIQNMLYSYLDELGVEYHQEGEKTRIGYYVFDCLIINGTKKILIECQGDYWHSLPKSERNDRSKFTYISRYFPEYEIMYVWEHEFYCKDRVLDRLKLKLGFDIETKDFNFKDLTVREINSTETKTFLDLYHYLGKDRGGKSFGVFDGNLLIAAIVFSPPLRQNTAGQFKMIDGEVRELSRLCIHPSYHKKNFASWFIKKALKQIDYKLIIAYADTTVGHDGGIYKASNFKLHHTVPADYWYVDKDGYVMHKRTLYGRAVKQKMTESEFAETKGYIKKYGGEKLCFVYNQR
jgi:hypothetical protein